MNQQQPSLASGAVASSSDVAGNHGERLNQALEAYCAAAEAGTPLSQEALLEEYADVADELAGCLDSLDFIRDVAPQLQAGASSRADQQASTIQPLATLGDFRIVRELGRGGMGVVYEAEQLSLGRRVALKVLPFAAMLDKQQLKRFKNEARAAATLDHPHVVAVHSVGEQRGVHYYAMHLVEGPSLAEILTALRTQHGVQLQPPDHQARATIAYAKPSVKTPQVAGPASATDATDGPSVSPSADTQRELQAAVSTLPSFDTQEYVRTIASIGIQAAQALDHAHRHGILHRDVKPGNLLIDSEGNVHVTDFGLARMESDAGMTMSGDLLGTLAYMSPEQALAKRVVVDHRTDIYSLGVTLYELLTLRPAYMGDDRQELLRKIAFTDPRPPRQINWRIPVDLGTIVCKAMEKSPDDRYETAEDLADDLQRFLEDQPIQARRPSPVAVTAKWARRHRPLVWSIVVLCMLATILGVGFQWMEYRKKVELEQRVGTNVTAARAFLLSKDSPAAREQLAMARGRLEVARYHEGPLRAEITSLTEQASAMISAQERFDSFQQLRNQIHSEMYAVDHSLRVSALEKCRRALELYRVLNESDWRQQGAFLNLDATHQAAVKLHIAELLFVWARLELQQRSPTDPPPGPDAHQRAVDALQRITAIDQPTRGGALWIAESFEQMGQKERAEATRRHAETLTPQSSLDYYMVGELKSQKGLIEEALQSYGMALRRQPDHYLSLLASGLALMELGHDESAEAAFTGAIALNPDSTLPHIKRARSCLVQGKHDLARADLLQALGLEPRLIQLLYDRGSAHLESDIKNPRQAIDDLTVAIQLDPELAGAYCCRGEAHHLRGDLARAIADFTKAIQLDPQNFVFYNNRGQAYCSQGDFDKAIADLEQAIRINPEHAVLFLSFGNVCTKAGDYDEAILQFTESIRCNPQSYDAYMLRGGAYRSKDEYDKAIADFSEANRLDPESLHPLRHRGNSYWLKGDLEKAIVDYGRVLEIDPDYSGAYGSRGVIYRWRGELSKSIAELEKGRQRNRDDGTAHSLLGLTYSDMGKTDQAISLYTEAIRLDPKWVPAYSNRGIEYIRKRDFDKALADFNEAIRLQPEVPHPYAGRGRVYLLQRKYEEAIADLTEAIRLSPNYGSAYVSRARAHAESGDLEKALGDIDKASQITPGNPPDRNGFAWRLATVADPRLRNAKRAVELAEMTVKQSPHGGLFWRTLGVAQYGAGQWQAAVESLKKATSLGCYEKLPGWFHLAMAYWQLENHDEARRWYDRASAWMDEHATHDVELEQFQAEAAELLELTEDARSEQNGLGVSTNKGS